MSVKKSGKLNFMSDDLDESNFLKISPKNKKVQKRQRIEAQEEGNSTANNITAYKKKKNIENKEIGSEPRQKLVNVMNDQILTRKQTYENLLKSLMEVVSNLEADYNVLKENEQKLEHLTGSFIKCIQQATNSHKQKLKSLKEIHGAFKKECEEMEVDHKAETDKLGEELEEDMRKLQENLVSKIKRNEWENLQKTFFQAMRNNF
ncbi:PREDICTED: uncharacterized protein LOC106119201 [Papilio xuthus]|uniref:Uncharacterized protein LOC106119201 n=1 Tax=Papilio xuthus TaxID=66420 RepID=A0AAJ6ZCB2_PAPXU|nr:PREDICTED: uncharacterized protein LOC106119201 [Papilio xuthus]